MDGLTPAQNSTEAPTPKRAFSLKTFCELYGIGLTSAYAEIKAKRLKAHKCGARTLVYVEAAEEWRASLPEFGTAA